MFEQLLPEDVKHKIKNITVCRLDIWNTHRPVVSVIIMDADSGNRGVSEAAELKVAMVENFAAFLPKSYHTFFFLSIY